MARTLGDFLRRFRPVGTPGAAASAGVPADRVGELAAELAPVFAALEDTRAEAERIRAAGQRQADARRDAAAEEARGVLVEAERQVGAEREAAAAAALAAFDAEREVAMADAEREVRRIRDRAESRRAEMVARVLSCVWAAAPSVPPGVEPAPASRPVEG